MRSDKLKKKKKRKEINILRQHEGGGEFGLVKQGQAQHKHNQSPPLQQSPEQNTLPSW